MINTTSVSPSDGAMMIMKLKWTLTDRQDDPLLAERLELLEVEIKLII